MIGYTRKALSNVIHTRKCTPITKYTHKYSPLTKIISIKVQGRRGLEGKAQGFKLALLVSFLLFIENGSSQVNFT